MPIHDWTRVTPGIFHDFHHEWISTIKRSLNDGLLPAEYYALAEQVTRPFGPDVLALELADSTSGEDLSPYSEEDSPKGVAVETAPPPVSFTAEAEFLVSRQNRVAIRHSSDHRVVAVIEVVSPGNKASQYQFDRFLKKTCDFLTEGVHLLVVDLFPPTPRDPKGLHAAIWSSFDSKPFKPPAGKPLTLAAYSAYEHPRAYVEPVAVGDELIDMPVFLMPTTYVPLPLEETYNDAFAGVPRFWRQKLTEPAREAD